MGLVSYTPISEGTDINGSDVNTLINALAAEINGNIDSANIKDNAVITSKILNANVTSSKLSLDLAESVLGSMWTSAATATWQATTLSITLPTAGTWLIFCELRHGLTSGGQWCNSRLYNVTTATAITDSDRLSFLSNAGGGQGTIPLMKKVITTTANNVIRIDIFPGSTWTVTLQADTNGKSTMTAVRIG
jgi:hypothetical protein